MITHQLNPRETPVKTLIALLTLSSLSINAMAISSQPAIGSDDDGSDMLYLPDGI